MADKRISQLIERVDIANNDVLPIVASGATTTNKVTVSTLQDWMQDNLDVGVTSVGLSMPSAFVVSNSPVTGSGNISVTGAGTVSQYIRGDGSLADFPSGGGGGGSSVNYYLNGSVSQGTIGGIAYQEMNKVPVLGAGTDFTIAADGYIASFITDAGDPALLQIPAGNWNFETYLQASSGGGTPSFYIELYKVNSGGTATLIASNSASPELIAFGTTITPYFSALAVPETILTLTDRLALRYYVTHSGRTITLHTENATLCQIITTFTTGLTALNGLTAQVQNFATGTSGTDFNISSSVSTHTFNLPNASATARGVVTTGTQTFAGIKTFNSDILVNGITVGKGLSSNVNNTAIGLSALSSNTTGTLNTAVGVSSLLSNTGGNGNTANGGNSLTSNTTGGYNVAVGNQSLYSNTTGSYNVASGVDALYSNIGGNHNTGVGAGAGYYISDGSTPNTTSDFSVYLGSNSKASVDGAQNEIVIGYNAIGSGSNTVTIGNTSTTNNYFTGNIRGGAFIKSGGTSSQFLMADGSVNTSVLASGAYLPLAGGTLTGALNGTSASFTGGVNLATSSGNVGVGITPSVWTSANKAIQIGLGGAISSRNSVNNVQISSNYFRNASLTNTYINTDFASLYEQSSGGHFFYTAPSGTAGNAISFTTVLGIASTGAATFSSSVTAGTFLRATGGTGASSGKGIEIGYELGDFGTIISYDRTAGTFKRLALNDSLNILASGNVGIGTASPNALLSLGSSVAGKKLLVYESSNVVGGLGIASGEMRHFGWSSMTEGLTFGFVSIADGTTYTEAMRITSGRDVYLGSSTITVANTGWFFTKSAGLLTQVFAYSSGTAVIQEFYRQGAGQVGSISYNGTATLYNSTSDYRLKEDLQDYNGLEIVSQLKTYDFNWKDADTRDYGVIAHELQEVLPNYVSGEKDAVDVDGNVKPQGVDYSKIVPILIKAIQELKTEIDSLKNQIK